MNQTKTPLFDSLKEHYFKKTLSFHVPGHKNGAIVADKAKPYFQDILKMDATELTGLDDLHAPEEAIKEAQQLLAQLYRVDKSYFLVNGSTVGNLAMILAVCKEGDLVLVQRNCHKSILNGLRLAKAQPIFLSPEFDKQWMVSGAVSSETVGKALSLYPQAKALILTYPNYYGMVNDIEKIVDAAHHYHIPVLVDEAHGAHFVAGQPFPLSAVTAGADVVVQSAHKTLPAMTMGSFLHLNSSIVSEQKLSYYLQMLQSSSPSYPIMASLDLARSYLASITKEDIEYTMEQIDAFKEELSHIEAIKVLSYSNGVGDWLKLTIQSNCALSGFELQRLLEEQGVFTELADPFNILFIAPFLKEGDRYPFDEAIKRIKKALAHMPKKTTPMQWMLFNETEKISQLAIPFRTIEDVHVNPMPLADIVGKIAGETIIPYPPGVPLLFEGERITEERVQWLKNLLETGARFHGGELLAEGKVKIIEC